MARMYTILLVVLALSCSEKELTIETPPYESAPIVRPVTAELAEASGIADSKVNPGHLWVHEDSDNPAKLYLLNHNGEITKSVFLKGTTNRDWEDLALVENTLYLSDTGDNALAYDSYTIYKFPEPGMATDTIENIEQINFQYPNGPHNAEALLIDPGKKDIYIITKSDNPSRIYKIAYPYQTNELNKAEFVAALPFGGVVSAAMSVDGREIILKTYTTLFYFTRTQTETIAQALQKKYTNLSYTIEPQGEAISFSKSNNGYFTLSEGEQQKAVNLYFYKKK